MTKTQMIERVKQAAQHQTDSVRKAVGHACEMNDYDSAVLTEAVLAVGSSIAYTLNNIALILCEMLPKEE